MTETRPLEPDLFASLDPPRLAGSRCASCGTVVFPAAKACPNCSSEDVTQLALPDSGAVWSWTVQTFQPRPPYDPPGGQFSPFAVAYVDLGDVIVESLLLGDPDRISIGMPVQLTLTPPWDTGDGKLFTYAFESTAFEPAASEPRQESS